MKTVDDALIGELVVLVRRAGAAILGIYDSSFEVATKDDDSPLTRADLDSHRVISAGLRALTPDVPVVSEESTLPPWSERSTWQRYWLVDPLDGTKEFVNRNGEFTVNIALIENDRATVGIVGVPVRDEVYVGRVATSRAEKHTANGTVPLGARSLDRQRPLTIVASRSHGGERLESFIDALGNVFSRIDRKAVGSSLKLCILAEGQADLYPRLGPTSEWDIAAAQAVLEAAGGAVYKFDRTRLDYNRKESFLNPDFVAVADPSFDWWRVLPDPEAL